MGILRRLCSDTVERLEAQQRKALAHGDGRGLAQQQAAVLLRGPHHLQVRPPLRFQIA